MEHYYGILIFTDRDGDLITISSDEELVEALDQFEGDIFRLYLKKSKTKHTFNAFCLFVYCLRNFVL